MTDTTEPDPTDTEETTQETAAPVRVALDAMGGDNAPVAIIEGAIDAVRRHAPLELILVGHEETIRRELESRNEADNPSLTIRHAEETIGFDEAPSVALRKKKKSSIHLGIRMVKENEADAFVSAGHTGAIMAVSAVYLRTIEGIDRAAIAVTLPNEVGHTVLLDGGANVVCKATNLYQFGIMGSTYAEYVHGDERPRVGLLSIGEEESKGTDVTRDAAALLANSRAVNFVGNVEAKLLYKSGAEVVVCDGFTGNIALKVSESVAGMITGFLREIMGRNLRSKLGYLLLKPYLNEMKKRIDHAEVGGAPLLGIDGAVFITHGSSDLRAISNTIKGAKKYIEADVNAHIRERLAESAALQGDGGIFDQLKRKLWPSDRKEEPDTP